MLRAISKKVAISLCVVFAGSVFFTGAWAATLSEPVDSTVKVNTKKLIAFVENIPGVTIIDSRVSKDHKQGFIESTLSIEAIKIVPVCVIQILTDSVAVLRNDWKKTTLHLQCELSAKTSSSQKTMSL